MVQKEVQIGFRNHRWAPTKFLILASCHSRHVPLVTSISSPITTLSGGFWLPLYERHRFYILVNQETSSISHFNIELKCKVFKCQSWIAVSGRTTHTCYTHTVTDCEVAWWGNSPHFSREHMESDIAIHYNYPTEPKAYEPSKSDIKQHQIPKPEHNQNCLQRLVPATEAHPEHHMYKASLWAY